ncbi:MAG: hypothetical protein Kow0099_37920 [Candidatus Abyssubacteria bacterium]
MARWIEEVRERLREGASLDSLGMSEREMPRTLQMLMHDEDELVKQRACRALGEVVARMEPSKIENIVRRLMWRLNPESGDNPVGVPEALGEIGNRAPQQIAAFVSVMMQYLDDEKLQPGLLQALRRFGQKETGMAIPFVKEVAALVGSENVVVAANAALALRAAGEPGAEALRAVEHDEREIALFCGNEYRRMKVCELARHACEGNLCFVSRGKTL